MRKINGIGSGRCSKPGMKGKDMFDIAKEHLVKKGYEDRIMVFDTSSATVDLAAKAAGVRPEEIAKSMTFMVNGSPIMIISSGDSKTSNSKFKKFFGTKAKMLSFDEVHELIGHDVGGVCPFGIKDRVKVYLDESLKRFAEVYPACGSDNSAVRLSLEELEDASGCTDWIDVCQIPDYEDLFNRMHPGFWTREDIVNMPEKAVCDEMIIYLRGFNRPLISVPENVTFGFYEGDIEDLLPSVREVVPAWTEFYKPGNRIFCGFVDDEVASFCMIENMGEHEFFGHTLKIGGPGCVGTVPKYRRQGIGLEMVRRVSMILKEEGYDISYIHYTGVPNWYASLGYRSVYRWNKEGAYFSFL